MGDRRLLLRTVMLSAKQFTKDLKVKNGKSCTVTTEKWVGQQEPKSRVRVKKARALLGNEGRQGQGRIAFQRPNQSLGHSVEVLGEYQLGIAFCLKPLVDSLMKCNGLQLCGHQDFAKNVEKCLFGKASGFAWIRGAVCACAQRPPIGTFQGSMGSMASSSSSLSRRSRWLRSSCRRPDWSASFGSRRRRKVSW